MNAIDDLIRAVLVEPQGDSAEAEGIAHARSTLLESVHGSAGSPARPRPPRRGRRWSPALRFIPAVVSCLAAILIGGGAVLLLHHRPRSGVIPLPPAARSVGSVPAGAEALAERLAVLRRPQTEQDRLPAGAAADWPRVAATSDAGELIPSLTRLVAIRGRLRLYLAVTTPVRDEGALWPVTDGDQVVIAALTPAGLDLSAGLPAAALTDADEVELVGLPQTIIGPVARYASVAALAAIVPDGVTRVEWTFAGNGRTPSTIDPALANNVALGPSLVLGRRRMQPFAAGAWFAADGRRFASSDAVFLAARAARQARIRHSALASAEHTVVDASPRILRAFDVFSIGDPRPARLADGYRVSRPSINELPTGVLEQAGSEGGLDLRDVRLVRAPSGLSMYVVPGRLTLCEFSGGADGGGGGCAGSLQLALESGVGTNSDDGHGSIQYIVRPTTHPIATVYLTRGTRTVEPEAGVLITRTSATFG